MHTSRAINAVVIYDSAALDFSTVYKKYFTKVKQRLVQLDYKSGFTRRGDQIEDLTQAFFTKVWAKNILSSFDPTKAKSKDPILTFLNNHVWGFFKHLKEKEVREAKGMENLKEHMKTYPVANSNLLGRVHVEDKGFCHDLRKVKSAFKKSLKGLEKRLYRLFTDAVFEADPKQIALQLGVSIATSYRLKESIKTKAQEYMNGYYSGNINFN